MDNISCTKCKHKSYCRLLREKTSEHFRWTFHNIIGHPLSEIVYIFGFKNLSNKIHNQTIPKPVKQFGKNN